MMMGQFDCNNCRRSVVVASSWCVTTALTIILLSLFLLCFVVGPQQHQVHGFSFMHHKHGRNIVEHAIIMTKTSKSKSNPRRQPQQRRKQQQQQHLVLFGLMEDMMNEQQQQEEQQATAASETTSESDNNQEYTKLFESIIFCSTGDIQKEIHLKLDECSQPGFLRYLSTSIESSNDLEEKEGLQELLNWIQQAIVATKEAEAEEEELARQQQQQQKKIQIEVNDETDNDSDATDEDGSKLSNTEVLKRANVIDQAVSQLSELSDDERPSDFMSDCREVVNLSRGFNDRGQMRVGG